MSSAASLLDGLISHVLDAKQIDVLLATSPKPADDVTLYRLEMTDELAQEFSDSALEATPEEDGVVMVPYNATYRPASHELMYLALDDAPPVAEIVEECLDVSLFDAFDASDDLVRRLRFYAIVIVEDDESAIFFRAFTASKELTRGGRFAAMFQEGVFDKVKEKTFLFDDTADCFVWGDHIFIRNKTAFHRIFRYLEQLKENAEATLDLVLQHVPISNEDEFRHACAGQLGMLAKLANISQKPYLTNITMAKIEDTIQTVGLNVAIVEENGQSMLLFDPTTQESRWAILKLLDDDYLRGLLTNELYESGSKIQLT